MVTVFNSPQLFFVIEIMTPAGQTLAHYKCEQAVPKPGTEREQDRVYNQVQRDLDDLERRTACKYAIRYWGGVQGMRDYVKQYSLTLS